MKKQLVALLVVAALAACSSSDDDSDPPVDDAPLGDASEPGAGEPDTGDASTDDVLGDQRAGLWLGNIGRGEGVYVVDSDNSLYGLVIGPDGAARSAFGNLGDASTFEGTLEEHAHAASVAGGNAFAPQGDAIDPPVSYSLNIVPGQTIESLEVGQPFVLSYASPGRFAAVSAASLAGTWQGIHTFEFDGLVAFDMTLTFDGTRVSGSTGLTNPDGSRSFEHSISGSVTPRGDFGIITFDWVLDDESSADDGRTRSYRGAVYFTDTGNLIVNTDFVSGEGAPETLSSVLTRQ